VVLLARIGNGTGKLLTLRARVAFGA